MRDSLRPVQVAGFTGIRNNIADSEIPGFKELGIEPRALEEVLSLYLTGVREHDHRSSEHE